MAKAIEITPELIARAEDLSSEGLTYKSIAAGLGISRSTLNNWIATDTGVLEAIQRGAQRGERQLLGFIRAKAAEGESRDAQWLLTHSPRWRDTWSDASAIRRELERHTSKFMTALQSADLPPDIESRILQHVAAQGVGIPEQDAAD
jgi:hypothetical protein